MHIPDGYLGPQTYAPLWAFMLAAWSLAGRIVKRALQSYQVPLLAIGAAFAFVIMMFNIPIPGGTTGHAVGGALIAIVLGPWAAMIAVSVALVVQALLFGDGGVTAIGANAFTIAVVLPFVSYWTYRLIAGRSTVTSQRRPLAAAVAGYIGLNASALATAVLFGIQPMIAHTPSGQPLYAPYPLSIAVPAMALEHLLVFGFVEAAVTGLVVAYLQRTDPLLLEGGMLGPTAGAPDSQAGRAGGAVPDATIGAQRPIERRTLRKLWIGLAILAVLSPIGIIIPAWLRSGAAWGEWSSREIANLVGFVPKGMRGLESAWTSLFPGYGVRGLGGSAGYVVSAVIGILVVAALMWLLTALLRPRRSDYVARTLHEAGDVIRESLFVEKWAHADGMLQRTDPRVKVLAAAALIVTATLVHRQPVLWTLYVLVFVMALVSRIPAGLFVKRVWLFVPVFTGLIVLPATLNIITPGRPLVVLLALGLRKLGPLTLPPVLAITRPGVDTAALIVARVATSVSAVVLLVLTTRWSDLLKALRAMKVSAIFVMVMEMAYRYVFVLISMLQEMHLAKRARTIRRAPAAAERRWIGSRVGAMAQRSRKLTDGVYQAMLARGYRGEPRTLRAMRMRTADWVWLMSTAVILVAALGFDRWRIN